MLTAHQCVTVGYLTEGEIICRPCAQNEYGSHAVSLADENMLHSVELQPMIRYEMDEQASYEADNWLDYLSQEHGSYVWTLGDADRDEAYGYEFEDGHFVTEEEYDNYAVVHCGNCHKEIA